MTRVTLKKLLAAAPLLLATSACDMMTAGPPPTDEVLIERFHEQREELEKLRESPFDEGLRQALGILDVRDFGGLGEEIRFAVWSVDFPGPGGADKGYAWRKTEPRELVESIDDTGSCGGPGLVDIHRPLEGSWYLYCWSAD